MEPRTPISLITGSLGSGKTTLLRRILETTGRRIAVLMNEFGEVAVDSRVIEGENVRIVELLGGCVCCSLTGEFEAAVAEIVDTVHPEHIVVEATGVAESDALTLEVEERIPQVRLDSVVCLVDAYAAVRYPAIGYTARTQIAAADVILINKADLVTAEEAEGVARQVRRYNEAALLIRAVRCAVDPGILFGFEDKVRAPAIVPGGTAPFQSFTFASVRPLDRERFEEAVAKLPASVFRAKGFVRFPGESRLFNYVAGRTDFEAFPADRTEVVFIGPRLEEDRAAIQERLRDCEV
jgi:G3E family GTPase